MPLNDYLLPIRRNATLRRVLRRVLGNHVAERRLESNGLRVTFPAGHHLALYFARQIRYETELTANLGEWVPRGGVAFDVGANLGIYSLLLAHRVGAEGAVLAFEPDPQNIPWLRRNLELNRIANVRVVPCALGESAGELVLYQDVATTRTSSLVPNAWRPDPTPTQQTRVRVDILDDYVDQVRRVDFVKIDTEGFECAVLRGGLTLLRTFSPTILLEVVSRNREEVERLLAPLGYRFCDPVTRVPLGERQWPSNVLCLPHAPPLSSARS